MLKSMGESTPPCGTLLIFHLVYQTRCFKYVTITTEIREVTTLPVQRLASDI